MNKEAVEAIRLMSWIFTKRSDTKTY